MAWVKSSTQHTICVGGKQTWVVKDDALLKVGGHSFVKMKPFNQSLVKLVTEGIVDFETLPRYSWKGAAKEDSHLRATLGQSPGWVKLVELRNTQQSEDLKPVKRSLFDFGIGSPDRVGDMSSTPQTVRKKKADRPKKGVVQQSETLMVDLPAATSGDCEFAGASVMMVRPVRKDNDLHVLLDAETLANVVFFLRASGLRDFDKKRTYSAVGWEAAGQTKWQRYGRQRAAAHGEGDAEEAEPYGAESEGAENDEPEESNFWDE